MSLKTRTVYIISSALSTNVYIGSTSRGLTRRLIEHKHKDCRCTSKLVTCYSDVKISPLCIIENCSRKDIELKEYDYINAMKNIVVNLMGTKDAHSKEYKNNYCKEYLSDKTHNDNHKEIVNNNYVKNKITINQRKNTVVNCNQCNKTYTKANKSWHMKKYHVI